MNMLYTNQQQLAVMANHAQEILAKAEAVFPFDLFPNTIVVDRSKVTIHKRIFFGHTEAVSVQFEDILNVEMSAGPLFATLKIFTRIPNMESLDIELLPRSAAKHIQAVIEGYIIATSKKIDCSTIAKKDLVPMLVQLGHEASS